ncbi:octicosapeptide/Phox/Bem1p family protein isoform 1, partial [Tanacetum coccineum]
MLCLRTARVTNTGVDVDSYCEIKLLQMGLQNFVTMAEKHVSWSLAVPFLSQVKLLLKVEEVCGIPVALRCQLPSEDLDALISITCDEDVVNLIEEYEPSTSIKIRAFLLLSNIIMSVTSSLSTRDRSSEGARFEMLSADYS